MMSQSVILGDCHFGIRDGHAIPHKFFEKVYSEWFWPLMDSLGIKHIIQVGDLYDKRKGVDSFSASESRRYFFDPMRARGIKADILIGNHDAFYKDTIMINSPDLLLRADYEDCITLHDKPTTLHYPDVDIDIIPWICRDNYDDVMSFVQNSTSDVCFGHFEFEGFPMYKGTEAKHGLSPALFRKYQKVYSGHYHTRSAEGNITYVGTPCEMTWQDWNDPRGVHVIDYENGGELTFYPCPFSLFTKHVYNEDEVDLKKLSVNVADQYVKVLVEKRTDFKKFDKYIAALNETGPHDVQVIEDLSNFSQEKVEDEQISFDDTSSLLASYVDEVDTDLDKTRLKRELNLLYVEAQALIA